MSLRNALPVYSADKQLLYYANISEVPRLLDSGRVRPVGTKRRIRALIALCGDERDLASARAPHALADVHKNETDDNPRGVWTFRKVGFCAA